MHPSLPTLHTSADLPSRRRSPRKRQALQLACLVGVVTAQLPGCGGTTRADAPRVVISVEPAASVSAAYGQEVIQGGRGTARGGQSPTPSRPADLGNYDGWLTFDDGPHPKTTIVLIDALQRAGVRNAVFFFVGERIERYPELARAANAAGYEIGYHSMDHADQANWSRQKIADDISRFRRTLDSALGYRYLLRFARPPFGGMTRSTAGIFQGLEQTGELAEMSVRAAFGARTIVDDLVAPQIEDAYRDDGLEIWLWNVDFDDWQQRVDMRHGVAQYRASVDQVWLFHEFPTYKGKPFNNHLAEDIGGFLALLARLEHQSGAAGRFAERLDSGEFGGYRRRSRDAYQ